MQPIVIAASPLTYAEYEKLSFADLRIRNPYLYIFFPVIALIPLIYFAVIAADEGVGVIEWQEIQLFVLVLGASAIFWIATWLSLRRNYSRNTALSNGMIYRLDEHGITRNNNPQELITWSNIAKTAKQSGQWILLRHAATTSSESYFLNAAGVVPPANRADLIALLKRMRIKPI